MDIKVRWLIIVIAIALSVFLITPLKDKIILGLDLQGGIHLVFEVDTDVAVTNARDNKLKTIKEELNKQGLSLSKIVGVNNDSIEIAIANGSIDAIVNLILSNPSVTDLYVESVNGNNAILQINKTAQATLTNYAIDQTMSVIRNRVNLLGVAQPVVQRQGLRYIVVELPGQKNLAGVMDVIGSTAQLSFHLVDEQVVDPNGANENSVPPDDLLLPLVDDTADPNATVQKLAVRKFAELTGDYLTEATSGFSQNNNKPAVFMTFNSEGAAIFAKISSENVNKRFAIVLDGKIYSAPVFSEAILNGRAEISGSFSTDTAHNLALVLRSGSLAVPVKLVENNTVGASLGADSIRNGIYASLISLVLVLLFMFYYRQFGTVANIALVLNLLFVLAMMSLVGATLTLPGIAGVILTIGMSVDANVLIYERIREEFRNGANAFHAFNNGYSKALSAILDANITTFIAALVLFQFGTGPVKGFAVTLSLGILSSLFTAIFFTRTIMMHFIKPNTKELSI